MQSNLRAAVAVAAQFVLASSLFAVAGERTVSPELIAQLHHWIDAATDLPVAKTPASFVFAKTGDIAEPSEMAALIGGVPRGLYDQGTATITLVLPWSEDNPQDVAVLLHELIHHRQMGRHFYCEAAKEHSAYKLQRDWLAEQNLALSVNWLAVVLASSCASRDFHPMPD